MGNEALYVQWGRGRWHVKRDGATTTCCGRELPEKVRTTVHGPSVCARCEKADPEAVHLAEEARQRHWQAAADRSRGWREDARAGKFQVFRCRVCGAQVSGDRPGRGGVMVCMAPGFDFHDTDPEELEAIGPAWARAE